jgi:hypothetical protein
MSEPGLTTTGTKKYKTIIKRLYDVANTKNIGAENVTAALKTVYSHIKGSSNQVKTAKQILQNINDNKGSYTDLNDLLFTQRSVAPSTSTNTSKGKEKTTEVGQPSTQTDETIILPENYHTGWTDEPSDDMSLDQEHGLEELNEEHKKHIENIKQLLEKEPKLRDEIKKVIVDQLVKAKIKPDQYQELNEEIQKYQTPEATRAPRAKRAPKPRAKKAPQSDTALLPMNVEASPKLPKGKEKKNNQKKIPKIVTL